MPLSGLTHTSSTRLKLGIDARPLHYPTTGIGRYTYEIASRLAGNQEIELFLYSQKPIDSHLFGRESRLSNRYLNKTKFGSLWAQYMFPRWARWDNLDVFWSPRHHLPIFAKTPTVVTVHDLVWRHAAHTMANMGYFVERCLSPISAIKATKIIASSNATKNQLIDWRPGLENKISAIPLAAFISGKNAASSNTNKTILFVSTFEPRKNLTRLLEAFRKVINQGISTHRLLLVGNSGWKQDIPSLIRNLNLTACVEIVGHASDKELTGFYQNCDFLAMPSLYEGFGLPIVEAMSFGKPILTSNTASMPEVAGPAALLINPLSVDEIADGITKLIVDREYHRKLSDAAVLQASKFSWDRTTDETLKVLRSVT